MTKKLFKKILIIGCGGHAKVITDISKSLGIQDFYYIDKNIDKNKFLGNDVFHHDVKDYDNHFFVALGDNFLREKITTEFQKKNPKSINATLIHPSSIISENCFIGEGTVIMPSCVINSSCKIGKGVIINTKASLDHDNCLMNYSSVAPGVVTGGNVKIGHRSAISIGAVIKNDIEIGADTVIGASSYVNKNIPNNFLAYGIPTKIIKRREASDKYLN